MSLRDNHRDELQAKMAELAAEPVRNEDTVLQMFKGYDASIEKLGKVGDTHVRLVRSHLTGGLAVVVAEFEGTEPVMEEIEIGGEVKQRQRKSDDGRLMSRTNWGLQGRRRFDDVDEARSWARELIEAWKVTLHELEVGEGEYGPSDNPLTEDGLQADI